MGMDSGVCEYLFVGKLDICSHHQTSIFRQIFSATESFVAVCFARFLSMHGDFSNTWISQGSVATRLWRSGIFFTFTFIP